MQQEEYDATKDEHQGWATTGPHGETVINEFGSGKSRYDAPILIDQNWIIQHLSHLEGKILTLLEACVIESQQKGAKDLTRGMIGELMADVINVTHTDEYTEFMVKECNQSEFKNKK